MIIGLISGASGIPRRVLLGAEGGVVASEQDRASWAERVNEHRQLCATPCILEPLIDTLQVVGVLPSGDYELSWPSAFVLNPLEEGQSMAQVARAVGNLSRQTGNGQPMQILSREEAREVVGFEGDLPESELLKPPEDTDPSKLLGGPQRPEGKPSSGGTGQELSLIHI